MPFYINRFNTIDFASFSKEELEAISLRLIQLSMTLIDVNMGQASIVGLDQMIDWVEDPLVRKKYSDVMKEPNESAPLSSMERVSRYAFSE